MKLMLNERNLARQFLFWAAIIVPAILFFIFSYPLWENSTLAFSSEAYNRFLENYKLPIYLFGICVPLVAIIVSMHRTIQTEKQIIYAQAQLDNSHKQLENTLKQIDLTESKNKADSYYSHVKFITDALESLPKISITYEYKDNPFGSENFNLSQPHALYKRIFSKSNIKNGFSLEVNPNFPDLLEHYFKLISEAIYTASQTKTNKANKLECLSLIDSLITQTCIVLSLDYNPTNHLYYCFGDTEKCALSFENEDQIKKVLKFLYHVTLQISDIAGVRTDYLNSIPPKNNTHEFIIYIMTPQTVFKDMLPNRTLAAKGDLMGQRHPMRGGILATPSAR
ncbi:hypothetical protein ACM615_10530 [Rahnella sp. PAMC25617]|uniref:hypothetical protein n=1 Tax=Rahnella sp. PAMC25617 TaxID=3399684 RepID=UPI003D364012